MVTLGEIFYMGVNIIALVHFAGTINVQCKFHSNLEGCMIYMYQYQTDKSSDWCWDVCIIVSLSWLVKYLLIIWNHIFALRKWVWNPPMKTKTLRRWTTASTVRTWSADCCAHAVKLLHLGRAMHWEEHVFSSVSFFFFFFFYSFRGGQCDKILQDMSWNRGNQRRKKWNTTKTMNYGIFNQLSFYNNLSFLTWGITYTLGMSFYIQKCAIISYLIGLSH